MEKNIKEKEIAEYLERNGFYVFPLKPDEKTPLHKGWQDEAVNKKEQIESWLDLSRLNYGVKTGIERDGKYLVVVDVDNKDGKNGSESFINMTAGIPEDEVDTLTVETPTGGYHYYYWAPEPIGNKVDVKEGIDVRGTGGYVVGLGSMIDDKEYTVYHRTKIIDIPIALFEIIKGGKATKKARGTTEVGEIHEGTRNNEIFKFCLGLRKKDVPYDKAEQMVNIYNETVCVPPLENEEVIATLKSAYNYEKNEYMTTEEAVQFLDDQGYFIAPMGTENFVWERLTDNAVTYYQQIKFSSFGNYYPNQFCKTGEKKNGDPILESITKYWLTHTHKTYDRAFFNPSKEKVYYEGKKKVINLWDGFKYSPIHHEGRADSFLRFIKEIVCEKNDEYFSYILDWLASIIQYPADKTGRGITVLLQGIHGTGKGFFCNSIGELFGDAYLYVNCDSMVLENFNGMLENRLLVFFDEVIWSKDKKKANYLKSLITERQASINKKFINAVQANNYMRFILATNNLYEGAYIERDDDRRYFTLDVSSEAKNINGYFKQIKEDLQAGGYEELMYILVSRDISARNFEKIPITDSKRMTVLNNQEPLDAWLVTVVRAGGISFPTEDINNEGDTESFVSFDGRAEISAPHMYASYSSACGKSKKNMAVFGKLLRKKLPSLKGVHTYGGVVYTLPTVEQARNDLIATVGCDPLYDLEEEEKITDRESIFDAARRRRVISA